MVTDDIVDLQLLGRIWPLLVDPEHAILHSNEHVDTQHGDELAGYGMVEHLAFILVLVQVDDAHGGLHLQADIVLAAAELALPQQIVLDLAMEASREDIVDDHSLVYLHQCLQYFQSLEVLLQTFEVS